MPRERANGAAPTPFHRSGEELNMGELRELLLLMKNSDIEEITIEREAEGFRLQLRRPEPQAVMLASGLSELDGLEAAERAGEDAAPEKRLSSVPAPLVGRFHPGAAPGGKPLVSKGDIVRPGQVVGTIETLNVLNEVETAVGGRVVNVPVGEGQPVEYGQVLMEIDPEGV
jgi:acetyl-CoA carboxylase biotin carboxyl carrier protein